MNLLWNLDYYVLGEFITCILSFILFCNIAVTFSFYDKRQRIFGFAVASTFFSAIFDIASALCIAHIDIIPLWVGMLSSTLFYLFLCAVPFFICWYAIEISYVYKPETKKRVIAISLICCFIYFSFIIVNLFSGIVFKYDAEKGYIRGDLNLIAYFLTGIFFIITIISVLSNKNAMAKRIFFVFLIYPFICVAVLLLQLKNPSLLMTGTASFAALLSIYVTIQTDLLEYDSATGLMNENKLRKQIVSKKGEGALYVLYIENMKLLQNNMEITNFNKMILDIGKEFSKIFERSVFHISTSRFAAIGKNIEDVVEKGQEIEKFLNELSKSTFLSLPTNIEFHAAVISLKDYTFTYSTVMDVVNAMLLKARNSSLKTIQVCDESIILEISRQQSIYRILKRELTLESSQFQVWYQPVYSLKTRKYTQIEALSRLVDTEIGDILPSEFIPIAESKGLIDRLGNIVFERVCRFIAANEGLFHVVSINFSVFQMANSNMVHSLLWTMKKYKVSPSNIVIELKEDIFDENYYNIVVENVKKLSSEGIRFHLDNFGNGKSNLSQIFDLPFTKIKFDKSLVNLAEKSISEGNLLVGLTETFKNAKLKTLVEGIETKEQLVIANKAGVEYVQGFLCCKPLPEDKIVNFLEVKMLM